MTEHFLFSLKKLSNLENFEIESFNFRPVLAIMDRVLLWSDVSEHTNKFGGVVPKKKF